MFEIYPSNWPSAVDANDPRDQFHRTALADARATTDRRPDLAGLALSQPNLLGRLRRALGGESPAVAQPCSCPA